MITCRFPRRALFLLRKNILRQNSTQSSIHVVEHLNIRSLIKVSGEDVTDCLQGLITNDMRLFNEGAASMYSLFLNTKGRVLFDTILYKIQEKDCFFIECDSCVTATLQKHLKMYKLRRKVDVELLENNMKVWVVFDPFRNFNDNNSKEVKIEGQIFPCNALNSTIIKSSKIIDSKILVYQDSRLADLGLRILTKSNVEPEEIVKDLGLNVSFDKHSVINYKSFRYKLGIGEGIQDFPVGKALPLEINCDYLHGISFHKGCYIGQELTARTHHTGVVRKRLMPLIFQKIPSQIFQYDEKIYDESGKIVGKFRGQDGQFCLGLMRISEALSAQQLNIQNLSLKVVKPSWWTQESQAKEFVQQL